MYPVRIVGSKAQMGRSDPDRRPNMWSAKVHPDGGGVEVHDVYARRAAAKFEAGWLLFVSSG